MAAKRRKGITTGKFWRFEGYKLPLRVVNVPSFGKMEVPRHITRIDIDVPGKVGTHGWQVRYLGTAFHSDSKSKGDPRRSLRVARSYLKTRYCESPPKPAKLREGEITSRKTIPVDQRGVSFTWRRSKSRPTILQLYCQVSIPVPGERKSRNMSVYIGTNKTVTDEAIRKAVAKGVAIRRYAEKRYEEGDAGAIKALSLSELPRGVRISAGRITPPSITIEDLRKLDSYKRNMLRAA